jgi:pimeloyl-ACP methyl ester carboxylesterase
LLALGLCLTGCMAPMGVDPAAPAVTYRQTHDNALSDASPSRDTRAVLCRFDQEKRFATAPDATLELLHHQAVDHGERDLLFALAELNYLAGERLRHSVKPWEPRDARDYYLASAVYAWFYLFGGATNAAARAFDGRFRAACDLYSYGLGWALTSRRSTNAVAVLQGGIRRLPMGQLDLQFVSSGFPWPLAEFERFMVADQFMVRGLSVRNRQAGLGTPLVAVGQPDKTTGLARNVAATVLLRLEGGVADLATGRCRGSLELYSPYEATTVEIAGQTVPLETDTTVSLAFALNQSFLWRLGMMQFLSSEEKIPTDVYLTQPYRAGRVPVVFVHGTFSSPIWWAEMLNTLSRDPELRRRCQFWYFIYNSGNPTMYSATRLRECLTAKLRELDPEGKDPALQQMVVIGHSQGGLLTKLTATDTGDKLWQAVLKTNCLDCLALTPEQQALIRHYTCYDALPFVSRAIFISTPHRGSYAAGSVARRLARRFVSLPGRLVERSREFAGLKEKLDLPWQLRGLPTSLDSMSPKNPFMLALADLPLAPGVQGHSIIAVQGDGDFRQGKDGLVRYESAHVEHTASEFIVRGPHSCQGLPPTIEEVRRILHEHLAAAPRGGR